MSYTAGQIVNNALLESNILAAGEVANADDANWGLQKLNDMLDEWAARKAYVYATVFELFTLQAGLSPHTIGPSGTFAWNQVPVRLESSALVLNSGTQVDVPMQIRDADWWAQNRVKQIATSVPTDVYYEPDQPNGSLFFWPIPNVNYQVRLGLWTLLAQLAGLTTDMVLPPGYRQAVTLSLAENLCNSFGKEIGPTLARRAQLARKAIQGNNDKSPRIGTADFGMPEAGRSSGRRSDFNWEDGNLT